MATKHRISLIVFVPPTQTLEQYVALTANPSIFTALHIFVPAPSMLANFKIPFMRISSDLCYLEWGCKLILISATVRLDLEKLTLRKKTTSVPMDDGQKVLKFDIMSCPLGGHMTGERKKIPKHCSDTNKVFSYIRYGTKILANATWQGFAISSMMTIALTFDYSSTFWNAMLKCSDHGWFRVEVEVGQRQLHRRKVFPSVGSITRTIACVFWSRFWLAILCPIDWSKNSH